MLVVSRKVGEKIVIGNGIVLQLTAVKGGHVRLAVEAPKSVRILREELEPRPRPEAAAGSTPAPKPVVVGPLKVSVAGTAKAAPQSGVAGTAKASVAGSAPAKGPLGDRLAAKGSAPAKPVEPTELH